MIDPARDFTKLRSQLRPWFTEFLRRWRDDVGRALELGWGGVPGHPGTGILEPYLVWDDNEKAFVCNPKGQTARPKEKAKQDMSLALSGAVDRVLKFFAQ